MDQTLQAIEAVQKSFTDFKEMNERRLKALEEGNTSRATELSEEGKKALEDMRTATQEAEKIVAKANRIRNGGNESTEADEARAAHRKAFGKFLRKGDEVGLLDLQIKANTDITTSADGGYAVPKEIDSQIESLVVNISPIRGISSVVKVSTSNYNKLVNTRGTSSGWVAEADARSSTNSPQLANVSPPMGEIYANPQATQQSLDDIFFDVEAWLAGEVATEFAFQEGAAFVAGNGTARPKGFTQYTTAATADSSRAFGTLEHFGTGASGAFPTVSSTVNPSDCLITLAGKLKAAHRIDARWVTNKAILFEIAGMKDNAGRYIFNPMTAPNVPPTILNYPIVEAEDMPAKGASSLSVAFGDFKRGYLIVDRMGTRSLRDPYSNKPYVGFYTTKRVGGGVVNSEAIKLLKFV